jgi:glyoxalase family protein
MRLVKKTVNQDATSMYHLFYADERGNPGTDLTFFEIPNAGQMRYGTDSVSTTALRVANDETIAYWKQRFEQYGVEHDDIFEEYGRATITFRDLEGQRLALVSDENNVGVAGGIPWEGSPVPRDYGILGLGPVNLTVSNAESTITLLTEVMGYREKATFTSAWRGQRTIRVLETGEGGTGAEIHIDERSDLPRERSGRGSVHHVAFRVENEEQHNLWAEHITKAGYRNSGLVERYYFRALYFREPNGILFELSTDGPGFQGDESFEHLGERLSLPPYFEAERASIEANLEPLVTKG